MNVRAQIEDTPTVTELPDVQVVEEITVLTETGEFLKI